MGIIRNLANYKPKLCLCGCGEYLPLHKYKRESGVFYATFTFIRGHSKRGMNGFDVLLHAPHVCLCGCGTTTKKRDGRYNRYIEGHENIGRTSWNKGRQFSALARKKMSLARLGKDPANKAPIDLEQLRRLYVDGKKTIKAVSAILHISKDSIKNRLQLLGWSRSTQDACSSPDFRMRMRALRIKALTSKKAIATPNKLEKLVYDALDSRGVEYQKQVPLFNKFVVDVLFPKQRLILEIFGRYWHERPETVQKDYSKKRYLEKCGYSVVEWWDDEIKRFGVGVLLENIFKKYNTLQS